MSLYRPSSTVSQTLATAIDRHKAGDRVAALRLYERVLSLEPGHAQARYLLSVLRLESGDLAQGLRELEQLVAERPEHAAARYSLGKALRATGRSEKAAESFKRALELNPEHVDAYLELAAVHGEADRPEQAEVVLRQGLTVAPNHVGILNNLAAHLAERGDHDEEMRLLERALEIDHRHPATHYNLANAVKAAGQLERALTLYQRAVAADPDFTSAHRNLGNLLIDLGRIDEAAKAYRAAVRSQHRQGAAVKQDAKTFTTTNRTKLRHDIEQFSYLIERGILGQAYRQVVADYEWALARLPEPQNGKSFVDMPPEIRERLAPTYNRLIHWNTGASVPGAAVNPELDRVAVELDYQRNAPGYTWIDNLLTPQALSAVRRFCLESTIWYTFRYANGYVGAFMDNGFCCPLLLQIAEELRRALPRIFGQHTLRKMWVFSYDSRLSGIPVHADFAAVNVNFWITPDEANLDPASGGLVVWDKEAPLDWDFKKYNTDYRAMRQFLEEGSAKAVNIPYRQNRVVIFNSDLFHETGDLHFRDGYETRRMNITMLYGERHG